MRNIFLILLAAISVFTDVAAQSHDLASISTDPVEREPGDGSFNVDEVFDAVLQMSNYGPQAMAQANGSPDFGGTFTLSITDNLEFTSNPAVFTDDCGVWNITNQDAETVTFQNTLGELPNSDCVIYIEVRAVTTEQVTILSTASTVLSGSDPVGNNQSTHSEFAVNAALPINLMAFSVKKEGDKAHLAWTTASEINNDRFEIERKSRTGAWRTIGEVKGGGNSSTQLDYSFYDELPLKEINYYRFKQIDYDGSYEYSPVRSLTFNSLSRELSVFPNPCLQGDKIRLVGTGYGSVSVYTSTGVFVKTIIEQDAEVSVDTREFDPGVYLLKAESGEVFKLFVN